MDFQVETTADDYAEMAFAVSMGKTFILRKKPFVAVSAFFAIFLAAFVAILFYNPTSSLGQTVSLIIIGLSLLGMAISAVMFITLFVVKSKAKELAKEMPKEILVRINDDEISVLGAKNWKLNWEKLEQAVETDNLFVFVGENSASIFVTKKSINGRDNEFKALIDLKISKNKQKFFKK